MRRIPTLALAAALAACVSTATPPPDPEDPVAVFLVYDAWHKGVVLPEEDGSWREWGYGEWGWYALNRDSFFDVFDTVLWPTEGALGRRDLGPAPADLVPALLAPAEAVRMTVPGGLVRALRDELWSRWRAHADSERQNVPFDLTLVHADEDFWFLHNCNDAAADWLEALGCEVRRAPIALGLSVR